MAARIVIPARYASTRLPGKVLCDIAGKPMLQWAYEAAQRCHVDSVVVATDNTQVMEAAALFCDTVLMTAADHTSGTTRIAEVADTLGWSDDDIIVGLQADEPFTPAVVVRQLIDRLQSLDNSTLATLYAPITTVSEIFDPSVVKVVMNAQQQALYFSRAPIPWDRSTFPDSKQQALLEADYYRHIGIYAYRRAFLSDYITWPQAPIEVVESLEQLRVLYQGGVIQMVPAHCDVLPGIDTPEDLLKAQQQVMCSTESVTF